MRKLLLFALMPFIIFALLVVIVFSVIQLNEYIDKKNDREESIGAYIFAFEYSGYSLPKSDSLFLDKLILTLRDDDTFSFSKLIPYVGDSTGTWQVDGFGVEDYIMLYFNNGEIKQISTCCGSRMEITMLYPLPLKDNYPRHTTLGFVKIDHNN